MTYMTPGLAVLEDFFRDDLRTHRGIEEVRELVAERDEDRVELYLDVWHAEFDFAHDTVHLWHDVEDREAFYRIGDFEDALAEYVVGPEDD